jgi:hypothetical protein
MYMSQGAVDTRAVMTKWLQQHPTADPSGCARDWFDQLFPRAYDLLAAPPEFVPSTQFGLLENVLSQLAAGVSSKRDVILGLARGLGFTLDPEHRRQFVSHLARYVVLYRSGPDVDMRESSLITAAYLTTLLMACWSGPATHKKAIITLHAFVCWKCEGQSCVWINAWLCLALQSITTSSESRNTAAACVLASRLAGPEAGSTDPTFVPASDDPLACLIDWQQQDPAMGLTDMGYASVSLGEPEHPLMLTDEVRSLLAVIAPWLAQQQPFLLVGGTGRCI